jgi:hypothetical protein
MTLKELKRLKDTYLRKKVHYSQMNSWNRNGFEGWNEGIDECIKTLDRKIKKLQKANQ